MTMKKNDLVFIHAPCIFDFRNRDDILFAYLSNSGSVSVSQIYEMYPLGLRSLQTYLQNKGRKISIVNLADMMLKDPEMDVEAFLKTLDAKLFGIDLHWLLHTQGSLAVAKLLKKIHPDVPVIFGGISATLFYKELIEYPQADLVIRGIETFASIDMLLSRMDGKNFRDIPNLCWKDADGNITINEFETTDSYNAYVDWESSDPRVNYFIAHPSAGCRHNCTFCGGSNYSMNKHLGVRKGFAGKDPDVFLEELRTIKRHNNKNKRIVTLHHWFEDINALEKALETINDTAIKTVHYTLFNLLPLEHIKLMSKYRMRPLFEISIESHNEEVRKMCGKAPYSNEELESWLDTLFEHNRAAIVEIYLMIGLPKQTPEIVMGEVKYADHLLGKYSRHDLNVFLCPMRPYLDPGSIIYDNPGEFGYKLFFKTLHDYEKSLLVPHWKDSLNYETEWLSREEFVDITYKACRELVVVKEETDKLPQVLATQMIELIDTTVSLLDEIKKHEGVPLPEDIRKKILAYNNEILKSTSSLQSPFSFSVYKNWYE